MTARTPSSASFQRGSVLLEGLFAIFIFSMGVLALVGLQAVSVRQSVEGKYRTDASMLASDLIGRMWASNRQVATLQDNFTSPDGSLYATWLDEVSAALPGVDDNPPTVAVDAATGEVTVTVFWRAHNESGSAAAHQYVVKTVIKN